MTESICVLGATSAIAMETCKLWAARGASFYLVARDIRRLEAVKADLHARGAGEVHLHAADCADESTHEALVEGAWRAFTQGVSILFVAYGTLTDQKKAERDLTYLRQEMATNFFSVAVLCSLFAARMEEVKRGTIAVISSVAGDRGRQSNYVYGAAKGGVSLFLQGLRNRLVPAGVNVVTIKPGFVDTPMTAAFKKGPLWAEPRTIAEGIVKAVDRKKNVVYLPWFWAGIMLIIRAIPEAIFKRMRL